MSNPNTKREAAKRRIRLYSWLVSVLEPQEIGLYLTSAHPPALEDLISLAKLRAPERLHCAGCGRSLLDVPETPDPHFETPNARARLARA